MKRLILTLVIGLVGGFAIGAYSPVADYLSLDGVTAMLDTVKSDAVIAEDEETSAKSPYAKMKAAIDVVKAAGSESSGALASFEGALEKVKTGGWVMAFEDVSQAEDPIARAALDSGEGAGDLTAEEQEAIDFLKAVQEGMAAENEDYNARLEALDQDHPEYFYVAILAESNVSMIEYIQHLIDLQTKPFTIEALAALQSSLEASEKKINEFSKSGVEINAGWAAVAKIIPAKTEEERAMKATMSQLFSTYDQSFANENAMAAKMSEYPSLFAIEVAAGGDGSTIGAWAEELAVLADARMTIQATRTQLANQILISTPSS